MVTASLVGSAGLSSPEVVGGNGGVEVGEGVSAAAGGFVTVLKVLILCIV